LSEAIRASIDALTTSTTDALAEMKKRIDRFQAEQDSIQAVLKRPGFSNPANDNHDIKAEHDALSAFVRTGDESKLTEVRAAMSVGSDPGGGYLVLPALSDTWTRKLFDQSPMRRIARTEQITTGSEFIEPIDKDESGASWVGEQSSRPETDTPDLAMFRVPVEEQYALQKVTQRLIDDASFDVGSWLDGKVTDKFARSEGTAFISGVGVNDPRGLLSYPTAATSDASRAWGTLQYFNSGGATSITGDALKQVVWGLRAPYRQGAVWVMNSNTANAVDTLKDGQNNYLWRMGMQVGSPPSLLGYEVVIDENMPDVAAGSMSIAFGNFKLGYVIAEKPGIKFLRDPFTAKPHVLFYAYRRVGGGLANSEAVKLVKTSA
jgi:HK97 family phage major capsid protein